MLTHMDIATFSHSKRLNNTTSGNPVYRVHFADRTPLRTASDSQVAYMVSNFTKGDRVQFTVNDKGHLDSMTVE